MNNVGASLSSYSAAIDFLLQNLGCVEPQYNNEKQTLTGVEAHMIGQTIINKES